MFVKVVILYYQDIKYIDNFMNYYPFTMTRTTIWKKIMIPQVSKTNLRLYPKASLQKRQLKMTLLLLILLLPTAQTNKPILHFLFSSQTFSRAASNQDQTRILLIS